MQRAALAAAAVALLAGGGVAAWRALHPPPPSPAEKPLDQRAYGETTDKEREDWMRKLGYVD